MAFYIKVTVKKADEMGLTAIRNKTADGNILLWQADLTPIEGDTIFDKAKKVGGVCLTPQEAKKEIDGELSTPMPEDSTLSDKPITIPANDKGK